MTSHSSHQNAQPEGASAPKGGKDQKHGEKDQKDTAEEVMEQAPYPDRNVGPERTPER